MNYRKTSWIGVVVRWLTLWMLVVWPVPHPTDSLSWFLAGYSQAFADKDDPDEDEEDEEEDKDEDCHDDECEDDEDEEGREQEDSCDDDDGGNEPTCDPSHKIAICHIPPGNPDNAHTICVDKDATDKANKHYKHGDSEGECPSNCETLQCGDGIVQSGEECDDGNKNNEDACTSLCLLVCHGDKDCDDGEVCTQDSCDAQEGCVHAPVSGSVKCDGGNACRLPGYCEGGLCKKGAEIESDDGNVCTVDRCDVQDGISHVKLSINNDGNACTMDTCDSRLGMVHEAVPVNDGNACTTDSCDSKTGAVTHKAAPVNDGNACTVDSCNPVTGLISHVPLPIEDDHNACTADTCHPTSGMTHTSIAMDDRNACTTDTCDVVTGLIRHATVPMDDGDACTTDSCDSSTGAIKHLPVPNCRQEAVKNVPILTIPKPNDNPPPTINFRNEPAQNEPAQEGPTQDEKTPERREESTLTIPKPGDNRPPTTNSRDEPAQEGSVEDGKTPTRGEEDSLFESGAQIIGGCSLIH